MIIGSDLENIRKVDALLEKIKAEHDLSETLYSNILISVNEAVTNSIRHGNRQDPVKNVHIEFERPVEGIYLFTVTDEGSGFNWRQATRGADTPKTESARRGVQQTGQIGGRGLLIMEKLAHKCIFNEKGNSVVLHFKA